MTRLVLALSASLSCGGPQQPAPAAGPPRLLALLCIDGLRAEALASLEPLFTDGGFRRLLDGGAVFTEARVRHAVTTPTPGRVALATGVLPGHAGIPAEHWFDRATGAHVPATDDPGAATVGSHPDVLPRGRSARHLQAPTLGDALGHAAKVLGFGWSEAVLFQAGPGADGVFWIDDATGTWVSSSRVVAELPPWLVALNAAGPVAVHGGRVWERSVSDAVARRHARADDDARETPIAGGTTFPYAIPEYPETPIQLRKLVDGTPFADETVLAAVAAALAAEGDTGLGRDEQVDLLVVGFDALGIASRTFGPDSQEVMDLVLQLDRRLAELMSMLDEQVGAGRWTIALSAGYAMPPLPDRTGEWRVQANDLVVPLELHLRERFEELDIPVDGYSSVVGTAGPWVFLEGGRAAATFASKFLQTLPSVSGALTRSDLHEKAVGEHASEWTWDADVHPDRSGDVLVLLEPGRILNPGTTYASVSHADADRRVPLVFYGAGIAPGVHGVEASTLDVAPTLGALVSVDLPDADGRVLSEALLPESTTEPTTEPTTAR